MVVFREHYGRICSPGETAAILDYDWFTCPFMECQKLCRTLQGLNKHLHYMHQVDDWKAWK